MTPTELANAMGFTTGGITTVIDRLERAGYVRRRRDGGDRRRVLVEATEMTAATDAEVFGPLVETGRDLAGGYSDEELTVVGDFLRRSRAAMAARGDALRQRQSEAELEGEGASTEGRSQR